MLNFIAPITLTLAQASAGAPALPQLTLEQSSALRCSVAFGIIHRQQAAGDAKAAQYPPMAARGQEFFVRTAARLMDDLEADRDTIMALVNRETKGLLDAPERIDDVMPACMMMLDASGL